MVEKTEGFDTFVEFFEKVDDEFLTHLAYYNPLQLHKLCMFLSLDLQIQEEHLKKTKKPKQ